MYTVLETDQAYVKVDSMMFKIKSPQASNKIKFLRQGLKTQFRSPFAYS